MFSNLSLFSFLSILCSVAEELFLFSSVAEKFSLLFSIVGKSIIFIAEQSFFWENLLFHRSHIPLSRNLRPFLSMTEREPSLLSIAYFIVKISCRLLLLMGHPESSARSIIHRLSLRGSNDPPIHFSLRHSSERTAESIFRIHCSFCFLLECVFLNGSKEDSLWEFLGNF